MVPIDKQQEYWNGVWQGRIHENSVDMNHGKAKVVLKELCNRPYLAPMEKLDIGCGSGFHAIRLGAFNPLWKERWTGIDLAKSGIEYATQHGLKAFCQSVFDFDGNGKKYGAFLLLDSLEHFEDLPLLGSKIRELADTEYIIIGNVPLYTSAHEDGGVEKPIDINILNKFLITAGCRFLSQNIYGILAWPYLFFEAFNTKRDYSKWND